MELPRESDAFDDDSDHWGIVELDDQDDDGGRIGQDIYVWLFSRLVLMLLFLLFVVWTGVLTYGD